MLLPIFLLFLSVVAGQDGARDMSRPYIVFPIPFEMPNRNDRSDQCWLRIEDMEVIDLVAIYCYIARAFLKEHIFDYNKKKSFDDGIDLDLWDQEPEEYSPQKIAKDWKSTTVLDPTMHVRIYVTQKADCRVVMYSREGQANYRVDCQKVLYFINEHMGYTNVAVFSREHSLVLLVVSVFLVLI